MRALFLFLLLLNVAYFSWQYFYPPAVTPEGTQTTPAGNNHGVPSLTLLSERDRPQTEVAQAPQAPPEHAVQSAPPQPAKPVPPPVIRRCLAVGPTRERAPLDRLHAKLAKGGVEATIGEKERQVAVGYWVHLPATRSERKARADMRVLRAKGVRDIAVAATEGEFVVSLGIYSRADTADDRLAQIRRLGYKQAVRDTRFKSAKEYSLTAQAEGKAADGLESTVKDMKSQLGKVPVDLSPCPQP